MKNFIGTCIHNPFESRKAFDRVVKGAGKCSKTQFLRECNVHSDIVKMIKAYPNDFEFYRYGNIYFYKWSGIEHFYK